MVITGASGNVGTALLRAVSGSRRSWRVLGVARRRPEDVAPYTGAGWQTCDLGDDGAAERLAPVLAGADAVVHLAWAIQPPGGDPPMWRTNLEGSCAVLRAVALAGVPHLVCASSVAAYRPAPRPARVTESWPLGGVPGSAYSQQKAALESMLDAFQASHPDIAVARIVEARATGAFNLAAEPVLERRDLAGAGLSSRRLPYPLVRHVAGLGWRAGLQPLHPGWLRLADQATLVDTRRAREELGWVPANTAPAALRETVEAIRRARPGHSAPLAPWNGRQGPPGPRTIRVGRPMRQSQR